jgi:cyclic pyranopterin phosphate synthase
MVPGHELLGLISRRFELEPAAKEPMAGPARYYRIAGGAGMIGIISPVSCHFCLDCNRIRVTSTGMAKSCLFASGAVDLKPVLALNDGYALQKALERVVSVKPGRHRLGSDGRGHSPVVMSQVGG